MPRRIRESEKSYHRMVYIHPLGMWLFAKYVCDNPAWSVKQLMESAHTYQWTPWPPSTLWMGIWDEYHAITQIGYDGIWQSHLRYCGIIFYQDIDEIFWPQPIRSLKLGHVTGQGSMSPTWVGLVSDPGKVAFIKKYINLDNIDAY